MIRDPVLVRHEVRSPRWRGPSLRIVVLSDLHVVSPWTSLEGLARVVARVTALNPDLVLIPGDFLADPKIPGRRARPEETVAALAPLSAPLGVHASLGNHDWADCPLAHSTQGARNSVAEALEASPITFHRNSARPAGPVWIAGTDSAIGAGSVRRPDPRGDLAATLAGVPGDADVILLAHEPDVWVEKAPDVALTVSGHTHGGQIAPGGWRPLVPSRHGARYAHGVFEAGGRHLVVSGGIGYTAVPLRVGVPPEITLVALGPADAGGAPGSVHAQREERP